MRIITFLFCAFYGFLLLGSCSSIKQVDRHGNPIFYATEIMDTTIGSWEVSIRYYTIFPNVFDPHSSVYISDKPSAEEVFQFALEKTVYNFVIHKNHVVSKIVLLTKKIENGKSIWVYFVTDGNQQKFEVKSSIQGDLVEHRYFELMGEKGKENANDFKEGKPLYVRNNQVFYAVIPYVTILNDFKSNLDKFKLLN